MGEQAPKKMLGVVGEPSGGGTSDGPELVIGTLHDVFGHTGAYVVRTFGGGTRLAAPLQSVSATPLGARELNTYAIGDSVLCVFMPEQSYGLIIGAAPPQMYDSRLVLPSSLVQRSGMGFFYDPMHYEMYQKEALGLANFSCGRPLDSVQGDWGYINEMGLAVWLGKFMAQIRGSDMAKLECFWGDDLVRLFAYNRQLYTASRDLFEFDDEGECSLVEKWTPFIWESFGSYKTGEEPFEDNSGDAGGIKRGGDEKSRFEPKEEKQDMVFRGLKLRGYLGDIQREMVVLPPPDGEGIAKRDDEKKYRGVLDIHCGMDGAFHVRSAKEIILAKTVMIPVPRQLLDPDDPSGDTAVKPEENYKPANQYGSGPDQEQKPYAYPEAIEDAPGRLVDLWDYQAYLFGKYGLQSVDAHEKDWETPEEADVEFDTGEANEIDKDVYKAGGEGLGFDPFAPLPAFAEITIDQRTGHDARYYKSRSGVFILDDGSVSIEDGYGAQILLSGGHITQSCPGDIKNRPGRSFIAWAPRDFIARAGWCADISAAKADVRIKAEKNLHVIAGDGTVGSIMLENRATGKPSKSQWDGKQGDEIETSGIVFKAPTSVIHALTTRFFAGASKDENGIVELNAGSGKAVIAGGNVGLEATTRLGLLVGGSRSKTSCAAQFVMGASKAVLISSLDMVGDLGLWQGCKGSGKLEMEGELKVKGKIGSDASIECEGTMSANGMQSNSEHNGTGGGEGPDVEPKGGETESTAESAKPPLYDDFETDTLDNSEDGAANASVLEAIGFSFRSSEQLKTDGDYKVFESRGQQMYRAFGITKQWDEPVVGSPGGKFETRPHPGQESWTDGAMYKYADPSAAKNVDFTKGTAKERKSQTEEGLELQEDSLESQYVVTVQDE